MKSSSGPRPQPVRGDELIRRLSLEALNASHRDRFAAKRLFKRWLVENPDLQEAVAETSLARAIGGGINRDLAAERRENVAMARAQPVITSGVRVGPDVLPVNTPRNACLPVPSEASLARAAARVRHFSGWHAVTLPLTNKPIGEAKAWEILEAAQFYAVRRKAEGAKEHFFSFLWRALPDRDKPESEQKPVPDWLDNNALALLDERARVAEASKTLSLEGGAA